jgi:hypothetical protein
MEPNSRVNQQWEEPMSEAKPFCISKWEVWEAYKRVKANQGAAGVDEQSIADFEKDLKGNLYKIWNRMSSGSYFPPPVRTVKIPKANGGERKLGIPTVADRIAQQVVKSRLEPAVDPLFHPDSYGYRPGKSALDAVGQARQRCWRYDWIVDLDIKGFFDNIPRDLLLRAVKKHAKEPWMVLYIERWLNAPEQEEDGQLVPREKGTPQGGVITPLTQKVIFCSKEQLPGGEKGMNCLISVVRSNIFMAYGALYQGGESSPNKCRSWPAAAWSRAARGSASPVTRLRFVRAASLSLRGRSLPARSAGKNSRSYCIGHLEASAPDRRTAPKICEEQRSHCWSDRNRRAKCVSADSKEAWLSRIGRAALFKFMFLIRLIVCSSRSSRRLTRFWSHVASATSARA